jgi:hypothetical protein
MILRAVALTAALAACIGERDPDAAAAGRRANVFFHLLAVPGSQVRDTTGTPEAQRIVMAVGQPIDSVRAFYRRFFPLNHWTIVSDVGNARQATMHVRRDTMLVWITLQSGGPAYTIYTLIGSAVRGDSAAPPPATVLPVR